MSVHRLTLTPADTFDAVNTAEEHRVSQAGIKAKNIGTANVTHNGLDKTARAFANTDELVSVGGVQMKLSVAQEMGLVDVTDDGRLTTSDPEVLEQETKLQRQEQQKLEEAADINEVFAKGDQALDFVTENVAPEVVAEASQYFVESGDVESIAQAIPANALNDYVDAKVAWVDNVLADTGASADLLSIACDDYSAKEARLYAVRGDANGLRRVADRVVKAADTNLQLAQALHNGGHRIVRGVDGRFSIQTENGIVPLSTALRSGWLYS